MTLSAGERRRSSVTPTRKSASTPFDDDLTFEERTQRALDIARNARMPKISEPGGWAYLPFVGPAWETAYDFQRGDYGGAAFNGLMFAAEFSPAGPLRRLGKLVAAVNDMRRGRLLASASTQLQRIRKIEQRARDLAGNTERFVVHHSFPMKGAASNSKEARRIEGLLRNHPANLKILPEHIHRGVHNGFGNPYTDPFLKLWHGTNDLHKTALVAAGGVTADSAQNAVAAKRMPQR